MKLKKKYEKNIFKNIQILKNKIILQKKTQKRK